MGPLLAPAELLLWRTGLLLRRRTAILWTPPLGPSPPPPSSLAWQRTPLALTV